MAARMARLAILIVAAAIALVGFGYLALALLWSEGLQPCENTVVESLPSPDGQLKAVLFERSCGATTGFSTQISIIGRHERPEGAGNVFIATGGASNAEWGAPWASVEWLMDRGLLIRHEPADIHKSERRLGEVTIIYVPGSPGQSSPPDDAVRSPSS